MIETQFEAKLKNGVRIRFKKLYIYTSKYNKEVILAGSNSIFIHGPEDENKKERKSSSMKDSIGNLCPFSEVESITQIGIEGFLN